MEPGEYLFGAGADASQVAAVLSARYDVHVDTGDPHRVTFVDTADWRLHERGLSLGDARRRSSGRLRLTDRAAVLATAPSPAGRWPRLVSTLPRSELRERIAPAVGIRALLPLAEVGVRSLDFRLLDPERKTRVRVRVDQQRLVGTRPAPLPLRVVVSPLRGYERDARRAADILAESLPPGPDGLDGATAAVLAAGLTPGESPIAPLDLDPDAPAIVSTAAALGRWLDVVAAARAGVVDDVDTEFLHELRAAVRATRSLLQLNADTLPAESTARVAEEFARLGRLTGPLRDLDVTLLELRGQGTVDVGGLELDAARAVLVRRRRAALRTVRTELRSPRRAESDTQWRATLERWSRAPLTGRRTGDLAAAQAGAAYAHLVESAANVTADSPPADLHRLRLAGKRLRALLDTYAAVYEPAARTLVLDRLAALQDCLGEIQDVEVQRAQLTDVAAHLGTRDPEALLSLGALRERLLARDRDARGRLRLRLRKLCAGRTRAAVAALRPATAAG